MKHYCLIIVAAFASMALAWDRRNTLPDGLPPLETPVLAADASGEPGWTIPPGWTGLPAGNFIYAAFQVGDDPAIKVTVSSAGGDLKANINRWEGQMGLAPSEDLSKITKTAKIAGVDATMVDLKNDGRRMLVAIIPQGDRKWFIKFMATADAVAKQEANFDAFARSFNFTGQKNLAQGEAPKELQPLKPLTPANPHANPHGNAPANPHGNMPANPHADPHAGISMIQGLTAYKLPDGWKIDPTPRQMRIATILIGADKEQADLAVSHLARNFGGMLANVNRWRGQVGLPPVEKEDDAKGEAVTMAQGPAVIYDFVGPEGADRKRLLVAMTKFPDAQGVWFFRLIGPHDTVAKNKEAFAAFIKSIKFE